VYGLAANSEAVAVGLPHVARAKKTAPLRGGGDGRGNVDLIFVVVPVFLVLISGCALLALRCLRCVGVVQWLCCVSGG
jgi:hypothetical protein